MYETVPVGLPEPQSGPLGLCQPEPDPPRGRHSMRQHLVLLSCGGHFIAWTQGKVRKTADRPYLRAKGHRDA